MLKESEVREIHKTCYTLIQNNELEQAIGLLQTLLEHDPNDAIALNFTGLIHLETRNFHLAYQYLRRALQEKVNVAPIWCNFGLAAHELLRNEEAKAAYMKAIEVDPKYIKAYVNLAAVLIEEAKWDEAEKACEMAREIDPKSDMPLKNLAHTCLAKHDWKRGWQYWDLTLGDQYRQEWVYGDEPRWDGSPGKAVVIYGEQGLGDEINYASVIPDAIRDCKKVIIDCDPRLEKLFKRSFPQAIVHGTRKKQHPAWLETAKIEARCAMSSLPRFYRNSDEEFPGTPYLKADPELVRMWKGLFHSYGRPVYGLCLHGGSKITGETWRKIEPEDFSPLLSLNADFVSLDYKGRVNNPRIKEFPWATQGQDYDLIAALIAALDGVVGVNTTAIHCANGLGVPAHILVPIKKQWRYEPAKDGSYVWAKSAKLYQQQPGQSWRDLIKTVCL